MPHLGNFELGEPRSVVVMDNASWHNSQRICNMVEARGAQLIYTPVCSPDLNPIEFTFSKYAAYLRRNAVSPIGAPDEIRCLVKDMHHAAMEQVTRADMIGIYQHCGFIANLPDS